MVDKRMTEPVRALSVSLENRVNLIPEMKEEKAMTKNVTVSVVLCVLFAGYVVGSPPAPAFRGKQQAGVAADQAVNPVVQWNGILLGIVRTPGAQPATKPRFLSTSAFRTTATEASSSSTQPRANINSAIVPGLPSTVWVV